MNHKRKRPKNRRAGCLFCKPHKMNSAGAMEHKKQELVSQISEQEFRKEVYT